MKTWKKILLAVLAALVLLVGGLCVWQWDNIQAVYAFLTKDSAQIAQELEQKREEHHQAIADIVGGLEVQAPTAQQGDAILSGAMTPEQVKEELGITAQLEKTEPARDPQAGAEGAAEAGRELLGRCGAAL